jgi:hypothetical protein
MIGNGPYTVGQAVEVEFKFYSFAGALTDPTTVTLKWRAPDGTESAADTSTHTGLGTWTSDKVLTSAGTWVARAETTGTIRAPKEVFCFVQRSMYTTPV